MAPAFSVSTQRNVDAHHQRRNYTHHHHHHHHHHHLKEELHPPSPPPPPPSPTATSFCRCWCSAGVCGRRGGARLDNGWWWCLVPGTWCAVEYVCLLFPGRLLVRVKQAIEHDAHVSRPRDGFNTGRGGWRCYLGAFRDRLKIRKNFQRAR